MFEWKHPNYYKELKKLREEAEKELEKEDLNETLNALAMASPFSLEEKQILLEAKNIGERRKKLEEILNTYVLDNFNNKTVQ